MTPSTSPAIRETLSVCQGRPLCVSLKPTYLVVWRKGTYAKFTLTYQAVYDCAARLEANRTRAEKLAAHKKARAGKDAHAQQRRK